jgi:hypothetical protein
MKRFEVVFFVDAPNLREAKRAARDTIRYGVGAAEMMADLIDNLREVKPPKMESER